MPAWPASATPVSDPTQIERGARFASVVRTARALSPELRALARSSVSAMELSARIVTLRLAETFTISRGSEDEADVVQIEISHDGHSGYGEADPIDRYGESAESALGYLEANADALGDDPFALDEIFD